MSIIDLNRRLFGGRYCYKYLLHCIVLYFVSFHIDWSPWIKKNWIFSHDMWKESKKMILNSLQNLSFHPKINLNLFISWHYICFKIEVEYNVLNSFRIMDLRYKFGFSPSNKIFKSVLPFCRSIYWTMNTWVWIHESNVWMMSFVNYSNDCAAQPT